MPPLPFRFCMAVLCCLSITHFASAQVLTVNKEGVVLKEGKPYRAIGVNYVDAEDTSYRQGFADLAAEEIPFARIAAIPFWPKRIREYQTDREGYLKRLDDVVKAAEDHNVGLVMSLFWADFAVPDTVGEARNQWGNPDSKTIAFMREYTETLVTRYFDSPAIWMWEFGNEYNLGVDLPNSDTHRSPVVPTLGTLPARDENDAIFTKDIQVAFVEFAKTIRAIDTKRPITTGNSMSRPHAETMRETVTWAELDTRADLRANLMHTSPEGIDIVSVHIYPHHRTENRFAKNEHSSYVELLSLCKASSQEMKRPLFLGEFGTSTKSLKTDEAVAQDFDRCQ